MVEPKYCIMAIIVAMISPKILVNTDSTTEWNDEQEMRHRMEKYAEEKFAHNYHLNHNFSVLSNNSKLADNTPQPFFDDRPNEVTNIRTKRDGGIISGPIIAAVVSGIIGMTSKTLIELADSTQIPPTNGGCKWFGTAPFCNQKCPPQYDYIQENNGRCSSIWFSKECIPDDSFGKPCTTLLGTFFKKRLCCKSDPNECTWSGRWMSADKAYNIYCRYNNNVGKCGELLCSINHHDHKASDKSNITGESCDQLNLFNLTGHATCGYIAWYNSDDQLANSWYKTSQTS